MPNRNPKSGKGEFQLFCHILRTVVKVYGITSPGLQEDVPEGILHDAFLLVVIKPGMDQVSGVVIDGGGQICLHHRPVFPYGELTPILDISLQHHHPVGLAETFGRAFACACVCLHLSRAETGFIKVTLQGRALEYARLRPALLLQDEDELLHAPPGYFLPQLDCLLHNLPVIIRQPPGDNRLSRHDGFETLEAFFFIGGKVPEDGTLG